MLEVRNYTPLNTELIPASDTSGRSYAVVIIKGSFDINHKAVLRFSEQLQQPIFQADCYYAEAGKSSVQFESDTALLKKSTDIVINGHAYTLGNRPSSAVDISLQVAEINHTLRVSGHRYWEKSTLNWHSTPADTFTRLPLRYENAYGGIDLSDDPENNPEYCAGNPVGKGFVAKHNKPIEGLALPNIETLVQQIEHWSDRPATAGVGFIARNWHPRLGLAGTYNEEWQKKRLPLLPLDFDERYYNGAHPDLMTQAPLCAGETFHLKNLNESGELAFQLPAWKLDVKVSIKGRKQRVQPMLDTVVIEPDDQRVHLTWRATVPCFKQFLYIDYVWLKGNF